MPRTMKVIQDKEEKNRAIRRYVGARIAHARTVDEVTQAELAEMLTRETGRSWSREQVANVETGRKRVETVELCAVGKVQDRSVAWYFADAPSSISEHIPG